MTAGISDVEVAERLGMENLTPTVIKRRCPFAVLKVSLKQVSIARIRMT